MNQTKVFSSFDTLLQDATNSKLQKKLNKFESQVRDALPDDVNFDIIRQIIDNQRYDIRTTLKLTTSRRSRTKKEIDPAIRCMARIGLGTQCSRSRIDMDDYCKSHQLSLPYGRIDSLDAPDKKIAKRRGRRSKNEKEYTIEDLDMNKYVQAILIKIDDDPYLLDQNNVLFQFNNNNEIAGSVNGEQVDWY